MHVKDYLRSLSLMKTVAFEAAPNVAPEGLDKVAENVSVNSLIASSTVLTGNVTTVCPTSNVTTEETEI